jgi:hypothetical protein
MKRQGYWLDQAKFRHFGSFWFTSGISSWEFPMRPLIKTRLFTAILCLMTSAIWFTVSSAETKPVKVDCDVHAGPCSARLKDIQVTMEIEPKPVKAMEDLTFTVRFAGEKLLADPYIDLGMPGMNMGRNRVLLKLTRDSVYQGTGIIVR